MNERIKSLLAKAHLDVMEDIGVIDTNRVAEKFAELIVRECAKIAEVNQAEDMGWNIGEIIKEHFGVDE